MSDTDSTADAPTSTVFATLIRGRHFDYMGKVWNNETGKSTLPVSAAEEAYLRKNAVEEFHVSGEKFTKPRFEFSNDTSAEDDAADAADPAATKAPRKRR